MCKLYVLLKLNFQNNKYALVYLQRKYYFIFLFFQSGRSLSKSSIVSGTRSKKSPTSSAASSPDLTAHAPLSTHALSEASDDSSLTSEDLEHLAGGAYVDSDTGLESMSSAETGAKSCSVCQDRPGSAAGPTNEGLRLEVTRLKCDKLDLLRQNVVSKK